VPARLVLRISCFRLEHQTQLVESKAVEPLFSWLRQALHAIRRKRWSDFATAK